MTFEPMGETRLAFRCHIHPDNRKPEHLISVLGTANWKGVMALGIGPTGSSCGPPEPRLAAVQSAGWAQPPSLSARLWIKRSVHRGRHLPLPGDNPLARQRLSLQLRLIAAASVQRGCNGWQRKHQRKPPCKRMATKPKAVVRANHAGDQNQLGKFLQQHDAAHHRPRNARTIGPILTGRTRHGLRNIKSAHARNQRRQIAADGATSIVRRK